MTGPLRSLLFVPGTRPDRFERALASGADAVVFDLEDSVEGGRKEEAREAIRAFLANGPDSADRDETATQRFVRINAFGSTWIDDDLAVFGTLTTIDALVLPKAELRSHIDEISDRADGLAVVPLLETARGVLNALSLAEHSAVVLALLFGAEDLTAQIGIPRTVDGEELLFARSQVVLAAAAVGIDPIDAVFTQIDAPGELRRDAMRARALGFTGKMAIHPDQVSVINDVFSPTTDEIARAQRIVDAADAALTAGEGVLRLDNQMVDTPVVLRARKVLADATAITARRTRF